MSTGEQEVPHERKYTMSKMDISNVLSGFEYLYVEAYQANDDVDWYDRGLVIYEVVAQTGATEFLGDLVKARGDFFTSDREVAALGEAIYRVVTEQ